MENPLPRTAVIHDLFGFGRPAQFVSTAIHTTFSDPYPTRNDVILERILPSLKAPINASRYEIVE